MVYVFLSFIVRRSTAPHEGRASVNTHRLHTAMLMFQGGDSSPARGNQPAAADIGACFPRWPLLRYTHCKLQLNKCEFDAAISASLGHADTVMLRRWPCNLAGRCRLTALRAVATCENKGQNVDRPAAVLSLSASPSLASQPSQ